MKTLIFFIMSIFLLNIAVYSQNNKALVLTKKKNEREKVIEQGKKIHLVTINGNVYKGNVLISNDSIVIVGEDSCTLNEILMISNVSKKRGVRGTIYTGLGGVQFVGSLIFSIAYSSSDMISDILIPLVSLVPAFYGVIVAGIGVIILFVSGKKYKSTKWDYKIEEIKKSSFVPPDPPRLFERSK